MFQFIYQVLHHCVELNQAALLQLNVFAANVVLNRAAYLIGRPDSFRRKKARYRRRTLFKKRRRGGLLRRPGSIAHAIESIAEIRQYLRITSPANNGSCNARNSRTARPTRSATFSREVISHSTIISST